MFWNSFILYLKLLIRNLFMKENKSNIISEPPIMLKKMKKFNSIIHNSVSFYLILYSRHVLECWKDRETYPIISRRNFVVKFWKKLLNVQKWGFSRKKSENPFKFYFLSKSLLPPTMLLSWEPKKTRQSFIIQSHWKNGLYCQLLVLLNT